jgi:hypothetical protein
MIPGSLNGGALVFCFCGGAIVIGRAPESQADYSHGTDRRGGILSANAESIVYCEKASLTTGYLVSRQSTVGACLITLFTLPFCYANLNS